MPTVQPLFTERVAERTAAATRARAISAAGTLIDPGFIMLLEDGDAAFARKEFAHATARFAEAESSVARRGSPRHRNPRAVTRGRPLLARDLLLVDDRCCAACGGVPTADAWVLCAGCRLKRYCSEACREDAWEWGHARSCSEFAPVPLPTSASVASGGALAAAGLLSEYGCASASLAVCCLRRLLKTLEAHCPPMDLLRESAAAHARAVSGARSGAVLADHAANAFEESIGRAVSAWLSHPSGGPKSAPKEPEAAPEAAQAFEQALDQAVGAANPAADAAGGLRPAMWAQITQLAAEATVRAMKRHGRDELAVQRFGCTLLALASHTGARRAVVAAGGAIAAVSALVSPDGVCTTHGAHQEAMRALEAISLGAGGSVAGAILSPAPRCRGGMSPVHAVCVAMTAHPASVGVTRCGMLVLSRCATNCGGAGLDAVLSAPDALGVCARALARWGASDEHVAASGSRLLCALSRVADASGRRQGAEALLDVGAMVPLVAAMRADAADRAAGHLDGRPSDDRRAREHPPSR